MELNTKYGEVKIYAKTIEDAALAQINEMANSPLGENANIRIMPDCHAGAGASCVIGTTMKITDKICPNLVGVDIGCGNHFIECYRDGWIAVHSGSRNIGYKVARYYQELAATW